MNRIRLLVVLLTTVLVGALSAPPASAGSVWLTSNASWTNPDVTASSPLPRVVTLRYAQHQRFDRVVIGSAARCPADAPATSGTSPTTRAACPCRSGAGQGSS